MLRFVLSALFLFNNVAIQAAAIPHAHVGVDGHRSAHIHLGSGQHAHPHPHPHPHDLVNAETPAQSSESTEHDDDAVYVPDALLTQFTSPSPLNDCQISAPTVLALTSLPVELPCNPLVQSEWLACDRSPVEQCALYLRLRTLRI